jgi:hypothetical protein
MSNETGLNAGLVFDQIAFEQYRGTNHDEIDQRLIDEAPDHPDSIELRRLFRESERASEIATALLLVLELCLPQQGQASNSKNINERVAKVAGIRLITLLWMLRSERFNLARIGQADIARQLGITRALVSHYARFWNKATGLRCRMQKRFSASENFRAAAIRGWAKRRGETNDSTDALDHADQHQGDESYTLPDDDECSIDQDEYIPSWERSRDDFEDIEGISD